MDSSAECAPRPWRWEDQTQWRDEVMRPLVLCADRPAAQRAQAPATHPETVRTRPRRFRQQGRRGRLPGAIEVVRRGRAGTVLAEVREELARLNALLHLLTSRWLFRRFRAERHAASYSTRCRRRSSCIRPYPLRLISFRRLMWPSTGPFDQGSVKAALTAA